MLLLWPTSTTLTDTQTTAPHRDKATHTYRETNSDGESVHVITTSVLRLTHSRRHTKARQFKIHLVTSARVKNLQTATTRTLTATTTEASTASKFHSTDESQSTPPQPVRPFPLPSHYTTVFGCAIHVIANSSNTLSQTTHLVTASPCFFHLLLRPVGSVRMPRPQLNQYARHSHIPVCHAPLCMHVV